jgi:hypothetical protein
VGLNELEERLARFGLLDDFTLSMLTQQVDEFSVTEELMMMEVRSLLLLLSFFVMLFPTHT